MKVDYGKILTDITTEVTEVEDNGNIKRNIQKDGQFKKEFTEALQSGKEVRVKRFINKHQRVFQDDTTIVL